MYAQDSAAPGSFRSAVVLIVAAVAVVVPLTVLFLAVIDVCQHGPVGDAGVVKLLSLFAAGFFWSAVVCRITLALVRRDARRSG